MFHQPDYDLVPPGTLLVTHYVLSDIVVVAAQVPAEDVEFPQPMLASMSFASFAGYQCLQLATPWYRRAMISYSIISEGCDWLLLVGLWLATRWYRSAVIGHAVICLVIPY